MSEFNPSPNDHLKIGGYAYTVKPHPSVPSFAFGQEGRKAFVYQIVGGPDDGLYALKKFKPVYRVAELVDVCDSLARFAKWRGLEVCGRECLHVGAHADALQAYPDLEYAVLMPWISGSTWYDIVVSETPLNRLDSLTFASATTKVLAALEEAGLAHCDIAAPNIIINGTTGQAHLIDVEDIYAPGFAPPSALPAGTAGYAHRTAHEGLWGLTADRFAGAVMIAEMAGWHDPRIRKEANEEHYFDENAMQEATPRYELMREVLTGLSPAVAELFDQAWFSETLDDCPTLKAWDEAISDVYHTESLSRVVSDWKPIVLPGGTPDASPPPAVTPAPKPAAAPAMKDEPVVASKIPALPVIPSQPPAAPVVNIPPAAISVPPTSKPAPPVSQTIHPPTQGGPVIGWTPLAVPTPAAGHNGTQNRAIAPAPQPEEDLADLEESAPDDSSAPVLQDYEPPTPIEAIEPEQSVRIEEAPVGPDRVRTATLIKPVLDLSHIDARNRPHLVWSETPLALAYVIEEADNPDFHDAKEFRVKPDDTRWNPRWGRSGRLFYRIRAVGDGDDFSPWSEILPLRIGDTPRR